MAGRKPATPANPDRGEHEIVLAGATYRLRPSHAAVRAIERKTGHTAIELYSMGNRGGISLENLGRAVGELIRAGAEDELTAAIHDDKVEELIFEQGLHSAMARVTLCLIDAASGGRTASGEAKAAAGTSGTAGAGSKA